MNELDDRFPRIGEVILKTSCSRAAIYRMITNGGFPRQIAIGKLSAGWRLSAVMKWMEAPPEFHSD